MIEEKIEEKPKLIIATFKTAGAVLRDGFGASHRRLCVVSALGYSATVQTRVHRSRSWPLR